MAAWRTVRDELRAYGGGLADKPEVMVLNKADAIDAARALGTTRGAGEGFGAAGAGRLGESAARACQRRCGRS